MTTISSKWRNLGLRTVANRSYFDIAFQASFEGKAPLSRHDGDLYYLSYHIAIEFQGPDMISLKYTSVRMDQKSDTPAKFEIMPLKDA